MATAKRNTLAHVQWLTFKYFIAGFLIAKGEFKNVEDAIDFAEALDMSYEQDYKNIPRKDWGAIVERDYNEYKASEAAQ
jgi:hypothetical protein